jgi:hypothetical protein
VKKYTGYEISVTGMELVRDNHWICWDKKSYLPPVASDSSLLFSGDFTNLRKVTSVCPHAITRLPLDGFS